MSLLRFSAHEYPHFVWYNCVSYVNIYMLYHFSWAPQRHRQCDICHTALKECEFKAPVQQSERYIAQGGGGQNIGQILSNLVIFAHSTVVTEGQQGSKNQWDYIND